MIFYIFISFVILLRIAELLIARNHEVWLRSQGAIEYGKNHYPFIVALHIFFFISLLTEYTFQQRHQYSVYLIAIYVLLIAMKIWVMMSLGKFWNTKILRIHNIALIKKGAYRFVKHPNYVIVVAEILLIPLAFELICTAVIFSVLNAVIITIRIKEENRVLAQ